MPTAIAQEKILLYKIDSLIYIPFHVEPDQNMTIDYLMKSQDGKNLIEAFRLIIFKKAEIFSDRLANKKDPNLSWN